jgi:hypothetical protein
MYTSISYIYRLGTGNMCNDLKYCLQLMLYVCCYNLHSFSTFILKVRERLAVNKQRFHRFHIETFNLKKLNELEGKEQYCVEISGWSA